jgi:hypothetical protein
VRRSDVLQPPQRRHEQLARFEALVRWWKEAPEESRWYLLLKAQAKDRDAPDLGLVLAAAIEAESETADCRDAGRTTTYGASPRDAAEVNA